MGTTGIGADAEVRSGGASDPGHGRPRGQPSGPEQSASLESVEQGSPPSPSLRDALWHDPGLLDLLKRQILLV